MEGQSSRAAMSNRAPINILRWRSAALLVKVGGKPRGTDPIAQDSKAAVYPRANTAGGPNCSFSPLSDIDVRRVVAWFNAPRQRRNLSQPAGLLLTGRRMYRGHRQRHPGRATSNPGAGVRNDVTAHQVRP